MNFKRIFGIGLSIGSIFAPLSVLGAGTYLTLPEGFVASILAYATQLFTDSSMLVILAIGLPVGFWVIRKVISLVRVR